MVCYLREVVVQYRIVHTRPEALNRFSMQRSIEVLEPRKKFPFRDDQPSPRHCGNIRASRTPKLPFRKTKPREPVRKAASRCPPSTQ